jgi:hypothetical protein
MGSGSDARRSDGITKQAKAKKILTRTLFEVSNKRSQAVMENAVPAWLMISRAHSSIGRATGS